jgi:hypothetical protein
MTRPIVGEYVKIHSSRPRLLRIEYSMPRCIIVAPPSAAIFYSMAYYPGSKRGVHVQQGGDQGLDMFQFWLANQNTDQVSGRTFEAMTLKPT